VTGHRTLSPAKAGSPFPTFIVNLKGSAIVIRALTRTGALPHGRATAPFVNLNQSFVTCDAAVPPDVRKGYAFPESRSFISLGYAPNMGRSPN
jgi:hypothetical protein